MEFLIIRDIFFNISYSLKNQEIYCQVRFQKLSLQANWRFGLGFFV